MDNENIRIAFQKVKHDITKLNLEMERLRKLVFKISKDIEDLKKENELKKEKILEINTQNSTQNKEKIQQTDRQIIPTHSDTSFSEIAYKGLKSEFFDISTGNEGVPTDRQTDRQTNRQIIRHIQEPILKNESFPEPQTNSKTQDFKNIIDKELSENLDIESNIIKASHILNSLDKLKKEIRYKFKNLTNQEMLVFSTIYQLEEKEPEKANYKELSKILKLSESSVRDYVFKLINKGIPIKKKKLNNKKVVLYISNELKKIASLSTILKLREI